MKTPSIKIVSLNVERSKHIDLVLEFLKQEQPDVLCVQELCEADIPHFESIFGSEYAYVPMATFNETDGSAFVCGLGLGIFSRLKIVEQKARLYAGSQNKLPVYQHPDQHTMNRYLLSCDVIKDDVVYNIGTTHFTWTPDGKIDDRQREDIPELLEVLDAEEEIILVGDFNAPRGGEVFAILAGRYRDNIPPEYTTSLDSALHRAGELNLMVDGFFSTPGYEVASVHMERGVSDHCALVGIVSKRV